jgi:aspartate oxidase
MLSNFTKKTYEICYAIFRLGDAIKNTDLRTRLEKAGLDLLEAGSLNDNSSLSRSLSHLEVLVLFSQGTGEIGYPQSQVLLREIGNLNSAIRQNNAAIADLNLEEFFPTPLSSQTNGSESKPAMPMIVDDDKEAEIEPREVVVIEKDKENAAMRQSAIVDIMRQVQNCRIKDLIAAFPGVSERTLRYDLQKLCEEGTIERLGTAGPGTYYQLHPVK